MAQPQQITQERALPRPAATHDDHDFPFVHGQIHAMQDSYPAIMGKQVLDFNHRFLFRRGHSFTGSGNK